MNSIFTRRSIRQYTDQEVSEELIHQLLRAAMYAPSAGNCRPWQFIVVRKKERLGQLSEASPYSKMTKDAPAAIVVCGDLQLERFPGFWMQDCSAATQNILLEAQSHGLGTVWLGIYPIRERVDYLKKCLNLPAHVIPLSMIPIGYPAQSPETPERYEEAKIHNEIW